MIPVTLQILGAGIDEEYADADQRIAQLLGLISENVSNDTPQGRLLFQLLFLRQEIAAQRLPIPVDSTYIGTLKYLSGSGELDHIPGLRQPLSELYYITTGIGLFKNRHIPLLLSMLDDLIKDMRAISVQPLSAEEAVTLAMEKTYNDIRSGLVQPPLGFDAATWPRGVIGWTNFRREINHFGDRYFAVHGSVFFGTRPDPARKPNLSAPVPGLSSQAPLLPVVETPAQ